MRVVIGMATMKGRERNVVEAVKSFNAKHTYTR